MAYYAMIAGAVIMGVGAISAGISSAITGIISTKLTPEQQQNKSLLLAASALIGIATLIIIIALGFLYAYFLIKSKTRMKKKPLIILFWVLFGLYVVMVAIGSGLVAAAMNKPELAQYKQPLLVAAILPAISLPLLIIGFVVLRIGAKGMGM